VPGARLAEDGQVRGNRLVFPPEQKAFSPVPVNTAATTLRSPEAARNPAITPLTISVV
jgi:hypothetical protein